MTRPRPCAPRTRHTQRGVALLEVLVAILIFSIGVLGIVGLQMSMTKALTVSKHRGEAAYLAQELIGTIWADMPNLGRYSDAECPAYPLCNAARLKATRLLPGGSISFTNEPTGDIVVTIGWTVPGEAASSYTTSAAVQR